MICLGRYGEMSRRVLVVGGSGFIGRHVVKKFIEEGYEVQSISLNGKNNYIDVNQSLDFTNREDVKLFFKNNFYDYIVNCSGYIDHSVFSDSGFDIINSHFIVLLNIFSSININKLKKFINIGSSDEYGNAPAPQKEIFRESPFSPYSFSKTASSHFLQMLYLTEKVPTVSLRVFLTYGPTQDDKRFIPQVINGAIVGKKFKTSFGDQIRDFCFIDDVVNAIFLCLNNDKVNGQVLNIGSGIPIKIKDVINQVCNLIGSGTPIFGAIPYRTGENMALYPDINKAKKLLKWKSKISLREGMIKTINYYKDLHGKK